MSCKHKEVIAVSANPGGEVTTDTPISNVFATLFVEGEEHTEYELSSFDACLACGATRMNEGATMIGVGKWRLPDNGALEGVRVATEVQAKTAYRQFASEPDPNGFKETYPEWEALSEENRSLWFRVASAVLNGKPIDEIIG